MPRLGCDDRTLDSVALSRVIATRAIRPQLFGVNDNAKVDGSREVRVCPKLPMGCNSRIGEGGDEGADAAQMQAKQSANGKQTASKIRAALLTMMKEKINYCFYWCRSRNRNSRKIAIFKASEMELLPKLLTNIPGLTYALADRVLFGLGLSGSFSASLRARTKT
jgi:hypothetical protein